MTSPEKVPFEIWVALIVGALLVGEVHIEAIGLFSGPTVRTGIGPG